MIPFSNECQQTEFAISIPSAILIVSTLFTSCEKKVENNAGAGRSFAERKGASEELPAENRLIADADVTDLISDPLGRIVPCLSRCSPRGKI